MSISTGNITLASDIQNNTSYDIGSVSWFTYSATSTQAHALVCNGQAVSRTTYSSLFAKIGTTYGSGDGSTTFNVPDLVTNNKLIQATSGSPTIGTTVSASVPDLTGTWHTMAPNGYHNAISGAISAVTVGATYKVPSGSYHGFVNNQYTISLGTSSTLQPPALRMIPMIRY